MLISANTAAFVSTLDGFSGNKLQRRDDLAAILEIARHTGQQSTLLELSFLAKFLLRTRGIMTRIGSRGDGYDRLSTEFEASLLKARTILSGLLDMGPPELGRKLNASYLTMSPGALESLLALFHDLSWLKNWSIDNVGATLPEKSP